MATMTLSQALLLLTFALGVAGVDAGEAKTRPVTKVVNLLKDMQASVEKDTKDDEETYEKMECWCKTNDKETSKSVEEAAAHIKALESKVEELTASSSRLAIEIKTIEDEVAKNEASLDTALALRKQQVEAFHSDEKDILQSSTSVGSALETLGQADASFLQTHQGRVLSTISQLQQLLKQHGKRLTRLQREQVEEFVKRGSSSSFLQQRGAKEDPMPGSTDVVKGVLTGLKDDFDSQLSDMRKQEETDKKAHESLLDAKTEEIQAGKKQLEAKKEQKAKADLERAEAKQEIKQTTASQNTDSALAAAVKEKCADLDAQYDERRKTRAEELETISKAIEVLSADEAHDTFSKTFATSFLQESASDAHLERASKLLADVGKSSDERLVTLALTMKVDTFEHVKKAIDDLTGDLKKEQADEAKKKDFCIEELHKNQLETQAKTREEQAKLSELESLQNKASQLKDDIKLINDEVAEMNKQIQIAGQNREAENKEFQGVVMEQRQTQKLLAQALNVIKDFYSKETVLVQIKTSEVSAPEFEDYKQQSGSFGVMSMLQQLIADAKAMEAEATHAETSAQENYEAFTKGTTASIELKNVALTDKSEEKGAAEMALVEARESKEDLSDELVNIAAANAELHESCDVLINNFDARQSARDDEIEALQQAKSILSGAKA